MDYLIVGFLVVLSACFSGLTLGFFSLNLTFLELKIRLGDEKAKKVYPVRKNGNLLLCTLLLGNVAVNSAMAIFLGNIATGVVAGVTATGLIVIFGEIIPQAFFSRHALTMGAHTVWLVRGFIFVLYPIAFPLAWTLDKFLGEELGTIWSKKEIGEFIKFHEESEHSGIDEDEERILLGALGFSDKTADMIATPRTVVHALDKNTPITHQLLLRIKENGVSRIPVYKDNNIDNIVGVLLVKDLIALDLADDKYVGDFVRPGILMIKEKMRLDNLLNHFLSGRNHLAALFDEFGVFVGVVSLEDVVEEILKKEIMDEVDISDNLRADASKLMDKKLLG